jgi:DNA-binding NtrC family response regulator
MKNLLIIDDDEKIRKIIKIQLHKRDITIYEADNRESAFHLLSTKSIDAVICDIKMKDTNGFVILQEIKKTYKKLPVIMLTGFIDKKLSIRAKELGSFDFITKPVRREVLLQTLSKAVGEPL